MAEEESEVLKSIENDGIVTFKICPNTNYSFQF